MDDLSYREFTFTIDIGVGTYTESISPSIEGIEQEEWDLMSKKAKLKWIERAKKEWAMEHIEISWA